MLQLTNVSKQYSNGVQALANVSVRIEQGEFVFLIGHSGSGKTTLMKLLYREEQADQGSIQVGKFNVTKLRKSQVPALRRNVGVVFQDFKLLPRLTVYENVAYAMEVTGKSRKAIKKRVAEVLQLVGLSEKAHDLPAELSGGEQQRVAIARAIVNQPSILIADEPTGNLDPQTAEGIFRLLEAINQTGTTVLMGTHNDGFVNERKYRVLRLEAGQLVSDTYKGGYHENY
ncbi:cell division ATP-binding protein FtsE [Suicoccus acidiformans]|uniref:Cell division ATP-binding protein FtsE n=1 Tax=Suicoccus acidiformans TaxID=2036206 RepID=A0A347WNB7_9LACT|nr:cell division ATP-binding protein FtsE [Suicoccus acidiformans]AXY26574.1 cell division ATP-binding protein FtsE [Suicoccus acidiformans]